MRAAQRQSQQCLGIGARTTSAATRIWQQCQAAVSSLVWVEHQGSKLSPATLNTIAAAQALGGDITAVVAGSGVDAVAERAAGIAGVSKVLTADSPRLASQLPERCAALLAALMNGGGSSSSGGGGGAAWSHLWAPATTSGKNLLPRAAALLGVQPVTDVTQVLDADTFVRPTYAGNAIATVRYNAPGLRLLSVRATSFQPAGEGSGGSPAAIASVPAEALAAAEDPGCPVPECLGTSSAASERPELGAAKVVVCGGRALKSAENFKMLERIADLLGGAVGASRAAVDAGWVPNDMQVGQTGKVVAPQLYLALGISGAIQHVAGMKDSKVIVAINTDPEAPIFQLADYGLVADLFTALPELEQEIKKLKSGTAAAA